MLKIGHKIVVLVGFLLLGFAVAVPPKTWDAIFNAGGEGDYISAKIEGPIRFFKYTYYGEVQPVSFTVSDGNFDFVVSGNLKISPEAIENNFYVACNNTKEAWISCFNQPQNFGGKNLVVNIKGVDLACNDDLYAIRDLRIKFKNEAAQTWWETKLEEKEKTKRKQLADFRIEEQEQRLAIKDASGEIVDARDGKSYRTIKIEGRTWIAENMNYEVPNESWCYEDKPSYCERSGRLYTLEGARQACPKGFHLPRDREWQDMLTSLTQCYDGVQNCGAFGTKLKAKTGWQGGGGTDAYGFTVFSSGRRDVVGRGGRFVEMGDFAGFWSAQNGRNETIWIWVLGRMGDNMVRELAPSPKHAYSVRCIDGN
jgi:uncharacterized protein (TIGR02145 family)